MIAAWWKTVAIALLLALITSSGYLGYHWHNAASERDRIAGELKTEKETTATLRAKIELQNLAVTKLEAETAAANKHYDDAMLAAKGNGHKIDNLATELAGMKKGVTCGDAMPIVDRALQGLK